MFEEFLVGDARLTVIHTYLPVLLGDVLRSVLWGTVGMWQVWDSLHHHIMALERFERMLDALGVYSINLLLLLLLYFFYSTHGRHGDGISIPGGRRDKSYILWGIETRGEERKGVIVVVVEMMMMVMVRG